jgi:prophage maintenance system killer protein
LKRPSLDLAIAFNLSIRESDEWFDEPDDLDRVSAALQAADGIEDPIEVAATLAYRVARAQGFSEGNKRTAMLLAKWTLDRNGIEGEKIIPPRDRELADFLVNAAAGRDVGIQILELFRSRQGP